MPSALKRHHRCAVALCAVASAACAVPAFAIVEGDQPPPVVLDPNIAGSQSRLAVDVRPPQDQSDDQAIQAVILSGPRGLKVDPRSRARRCSPAQASNFECPAGSRVGKGQAVGHATGAIVPGGRQDFVATVDAFLAPPVRSGDVAGAVLQVTENRSGARASATGRIVRGSRDASPFGVKLRFDSLPSYPGVTLTVDSISLLAQGRRTVTKHGKRHRYSLLTNPGKCSGSWPFRVSIVYADHRDDSDFAAACRKR
jgi:hypothetical protein